MIFDKMTIKYTLFGISSGGQDSLIQQVLIISFLLNFENYKIQY